jgi:FKBP-type peptidyl-prolyl cis-trans isomerase FkpA
MEFLCGKLEPLGMKFPQDTKSPLYLLNHKQAMNMKKLIGIILVLSALSWMACGEDIPPCDPADQEAQILQYLQDSSLVAERTESGLYYIIEEEGSRIRPTETSEVSIIYKGYLTDGTEFDNSNGAARTFPLQGVIAGWTEGVPLFKEGGKGMLFIPCQLGYGGTQRGPIPPSSVLIFEIELVKVL